MEIISDAPDWDWPLVIWLAGPDGLPGGVEAVRISCDIEVSADSEEPSHHALRDARMLAQFVE